MAWRGYLAKSGYSAGKATREQLLHAVHKQ